MGQPGQWPSGHAGMVADDGCTRALARGRKQDAVEWYAAAVRTWPDRWSSTANYASLLPEWREAERATLAEVFAAWQAKPPTFP